MTNLQKSTLELLQLDLCTSVINTVDTASTLLLRRCLSPRVIACSLRERCCWFCICSEKLPSSGWVIGDGRSPPYKCPVLGTINQLHFTSKALLRPLWNSILWVIYFLINLHLNSYTFMSLKLFTFTVRRLTPSGATCWQMQRQDITYRPVSPTRVSCTGNWWPVCRQLYKMHSTVSK